MDTSRYSNFPSNIDTFPVKVNPQYENLADIRDYNELKQKNYLTEVEQIRLSELTNKLRDMIWFAEDLNSISGGLTTMQRFFRDNTIPQLEQYKNELKQFAQDYQVLTQLKFQSWTTSANKDYDIHSGLETIGEETELTIDSPANIEIVIDGNQIAYNNYTIATNSTGKKTIIRFNSSYDVPVGKRMEARWQDTSGRVFSVNSHNHNKSDILDLPNVAKTGNYKDLVGIPTSFSPVAHKHPWGQISEIPSSFTPSAHSHDDRYYTESEINTKLAGKASSSHKHSIADITGLQGEIDSLKSSVSNGKNTIASAITDKGVSASGSDSYVTLANKIGQIPTGEMTFLGVETGSVSGSISVVNLTIPSGVKNPEKLIAIGYSCSVKSSSNCAPHISYYESHKINAGTIHRPEAPSSSWGSWNYFVSYFEATAAKRVQRLVKYGEGTLKIPLAIDPTKVMILCSSDVGYAAASKITSTSCEISASGYTGAVNVTIVEF